MKYRNKSDKLVQAICAKCRYWLPTYPTRDTVGICRRDPPPWDKKKHRTEPNDWCGEFTPEVDEI